MDKNEKQIREKTPSNNADTPKTASMIRKSKLYKRILLIGSPPTANKLHRSFEARLSNGESADV